MSKKTRNRFTQQQKDRAVDDYLSGKRAAQDTELYWRGL